MPALCALAQVSDTTRHKRLCTGHLQAPYFRQQVTYGAGTRMSARAPRSERNALVRQVRAQPPAPRACSPGTPGASGYHSTADRSRVCTRSCHAPSSSARPAGAAPPTKLPAPPPAPGTAAPQPGPGRGTESRSDAAVAAAKLEKPLRKLPSTECASTNTEEAAPAGAPAAAAPAGGPGPAGPSSGPPAPACP